MYLHGPRTVSDMCRKFWMTSCSVPSEELELASAAAATAVAVFAFTAVAVVVFVKDVADKIGTGNWEGFCCGGTSDLPPLPLLLK